MPVKINFVDVPYPGRKRRFSIYAETLRTFVAENHEIARLDTEGVTPNALYAGLRRAMNDNPEYKEMVRIRRHGDDIYLQSTDWNAV